MLGADWRSENSYHEIKTAEAVDIAWEWLRRDREYQKDYRTLVSSKQSSATDAFRRKWGLTFPG
ncbi:transcriptional regulator domain-containing protein [Bradyrhizobium pachyrhizi]|uniref:transcriptional regulator domain-containing protein n=1 Tax=Bradyrhizobium pachyrhizi TaxID=280333 RepID=UPI00067BE14D